MIVGFDANEAPVAQELPLWQAAVGLVLRQTGSIWYGWANLVIFAVLLAPVSGPPSN